MRVAATTNGGEERLRLTVHARQDAAPAHRRCIALLTRESPSSSLHPCPEVRRRGLRVGAALVAAAAAGLLVRLDELRQFVLHLVSFCVLMFLVSPIAITSIFCFSM